MPFKSPPKRGQKRRIVLEFRGPLTDAQTKRLSKAIKAVAKKHKLKIVKRARG
jgi:hypothetical protein